MCPGLIEASTVCRAQPAAAAGIIRGMCPGLIEATRGALREVRDFPTYYPGYVPRPH